MLDSALFGFPEDAAASTRGSAARAQSAASSAGRDVRALEDRLERLSLVTMAMWSLLQDKTRLTEEDLLERVRTLDLMDGNPERQGDRHGEQVPQVRPDDGPAPPQVHLLRRGPAHRQRVRHDLNGARRWALCGRGGRGDRLQIEVRADRHKGDGRRCACTHGPVAPACNSSRPFAEYVMIAQHHVDALQVRLQSLRAAVVAAAGGDGPAHRPPADRHAVAAAWRPERPL